MNILLPQKENVVGEKDFLCAESVAQELHFIEHLFVPADRDAVIANGSRVIAAESAMVRATARRQHRVMRIARQVVKTPVYDRQIVECGNLGPAFGTSNPPCCITKYDSRQSV